MEKDAVVNAIPTLMATKRVFVSPFQASRVNATIVDAGEQEQETRSDHCIAPQEE
jgi:hypothetical protein